MEMESVGVPAIEQPYYNVKRPVDDLWLWWTLANVIGYLIFEVPSKLLGKSFFETIITLIATFASVVLLIWVLNRYLSNFNWKQWVVVNIIGSILGFVIVFAVLIVMDLLYKLFSEKNSVPELVIDLSVYAVVGLVLALAQWRVLKHYARGQGKNLWVVANVISVIIFALLYGAVKQLSDNAYLQIAGNTIASALEAVIIGYTLMQILRPYAPTPHPGTTGA